MSENIKGKVISGLFWQFGERICAQLVTFIVSIILARILEPEHYGAIAIVNVFIALANVFVTGSFGNSLIQKKDADNLDFSSVFYFNILLGVVVYFVIFATSPYIASFYRLPILSHVLRVLGLRIIISGVNSVQHAYVSKNMIFKRFFWSTLGGTLGSAVVGISMAYMGFGIWALVGQYMFNSIIDTLVLWFTVKWRPRLEFSVKRISSLFSYGWKLLVSNLLDTAYNELSGLIIGRKYTSADLAYYNRGQSFPNLVVTNVNTSIQNVLFPALSTEQNKKETVKNMMRRSIRISSYIMLPLMTGLAFVAKPFVELLLTSKWIFCVPYLQIACFVYAFMPIQTANLQAIKAMGRSDIFLKLEIIKKIMGLSILILVVRHGVLAIAVSGIFIAVISSVINSRPNKNLLNYGYIEQIKDLLNGFIPLLAMCIVVYVVSFINIGLTVTIVIQIISGAVTYILISHITKNESYTYILKIIKNIVKRKK